MAVDAVAALWRAQRRRRWRTWIALALLLAVGAGSGLACLAGARRTASTFDRYAEVGGFPDVNTGHGEPPAEAESIIAGFEGVASHATVVGFVGFVEDIDPALIKYFVGSWEAPVPRVGPTLRTGRYPRSDQSDEVLAVGRGVGLAGIEPGDELTIQLFTSDFSGMEAKTVVVVGTGDDPLAAVADATYDRTAIYFTPAFTKANAAALLAWSASEFTAAPGPGGEEALISQLSEVGWAVEETRPVAQARVQQAIRPLVTILALLGGLVLVTTLLVVGQAMVRQSDAGGAERQAARAMGCTRWQLRGLDALSMLSVALPGTILATLVAVAVSPLFPAGAIRGLDPTRGVAADLTVLGAGAGGVLVLLVLLGGLGRARGSMGPDREVARPFLSGLAAIRPSITPGLRLAVGGTTHQRRRFWTTVALSASGLGLLVGGIAFVAALERLTDEPARYGAAWDLTTRNAFGDVPADEVRALTADDPDIDGLAGGTVSTVLVDGLTVPVMAFLPITADLWPTVVDGTVPRRDDEVLVGVDVLRALGVDVGDEVRLASAFSPTAEPAPVTIVGTAVFPSIELAGLDPARLGQGIAMTWGIYERILLDDDARDDGGGPDHHPDMMFFDLATGVDPQTVIDRYPEGMPELSGFAPTEWFTSLAPAEVIETGRATGLIWSVIALLAVTLLVSLGHALASSVRQHRRDYATLRTIGFTSRQVLGAVTWQSAAPVVLALGLALPLGTALGRWWWRILARLIGVIDTPVVPVAPLVVVASAALIAAGLLAVRPGLRAAHTTAAEGLKNE